MAPENRDTVRCLGGNPFLFLSVLRQALDDEQKRLQTGSGQKLNNDFLITAPNEFLIISLLNFTFLSIALRMNCPALQRRE